MKNNTSSPGVRWYIGVMTIGILSFYGAAAQGEAGGDHGRPGSVRIRAGLPAGVDIPVAPPTHAVRTETAIYTEDGVLPPVSTAARAGACASDRDCDDCNACTLDECIFATGGQIGVCSNAQKPLCDVCGDDIFCNGIEICDDVAGCQNATMRPCDTDPTLICNENEALAGNPPCVPPCKIGDNVDDGDFCNGTEVCDLIECVGGNNAGAPCTDDTPCTGSGFCGGVVISINSPCGSTAACDSTTSTCVLWGRCCTPDVNAPTGFACSRTKKDACTGQWLQIGDNSSTPNVDDANCIDPAPAGEGNAGETFNCPAYGAGVAPAGPFTGEIGDTGFAACSSHFDLGDDYAMVLSGPGEVNENKFIRVTTFRWVGGFRQNGIQDTAGRYRVVFYDSSGNRIEDTITNGELAGASALRTILFDENPIIPARGFVVIEPAARFAPFARNFWTTTDASGVDVGSNDTSTYWVDGGPKNAQTEFPGTSGVLAFEIVGDIVDTPLGACCDITTGECIQTLPWLCNGFFQGPGVACQVCANAPFTACSVDADCPACASNGAPCDPNAECPGSPPGACVGGTCDGGDNVGQACNVNVDCPAGDTCSATASCNPVPPACALSACCVTAATGDPACVGGTNPGVPCPVGDECLGGGTCTGTFAGIKFCRNGSRADNVCQSDADCPNGGSCIGTTARVGDCVTVRTASCVGPGAGAGNPCFSNGDCDPANLCKADCPAGSFNEGGFGTSCVPQLCTQPPSGFDTCAEAAMPGNLRVIHVPSLTEGPVTHTFTGNNTNATYNDNDDDVGVGNGTCNDSRFTSQGAFKDLGWWHAFQIDDCAIVRVDFCGTFERSGEVQQPQWATIMSACNPCGGAISSSVVGAPIGDDLASFNRGLPHCTGGDDIWQSFGPLPAGTYWVPVFTAPGGHFGEYQFHVTVGACPIAACCLPDFFCVDPGTQFLVTDGAGNPIPCGGTVTCAVGSCESCALARESDCTSIGGFWNGLGNLPSGGASFIVDCGFGGGGPCEIGSCCAGPGECRDTFGDPALCDRTLDPPDPDCCDPQSPSTCMNRSLCATEGGPNANFVGGAQCDFPQPPCPACLIQGAENCQLPAKTPEFSNASASISDLTIPPNGTVSADDFVPMGDTLTSVCAWGFYHDATLQGAESFDCSGAVADEFRVRVFGDAGGMPDTSNLIGESLVTGANISRGKEPDTAFSNLFSDTTNAVPQGYTLILDTPITGLSVGVKHWLEIANNTTGPTDAAKTCWWNWLNSFPSASGESGFSVSGANSGGVDDPAVYLSGASRYIVGSGRPYDLAFCVGTGPAGDQPLALTPVTDVKGCCWTCPQDGEPVPTISTQLECADGANIGGVWNALDPGCTGTFLDLGDLVPDSCTGAAQARLANAGQIPPCGDGVIDPGEQCDPGPDVPGDNCDITCQLICPTPPPPVKVCQGGTNALEPCTTIADCPDPSGTCEVLGGAVTVSAGLHATDSNCAGTDGPTSIPSESGFIGAGHDAWFFYVTDCTGRLHVNACATQNGLPKGGFNIQDNTVALYHDPDNPSVCVCPGASTAFQSGAASDEGCNGIADAGSGILNRIVLPGECWTVRMTNFGATASASAGGPALFDIACSASACFTSQPPSIQQLADSGGTPRNNLKGRFLPVVVNDVGRESAIQVEFVDLPPPYDLWNGTKMFAQAPIEVCETSTVAGGPCAVNTYTTAKLECTGTPFTTDWNALGVINVWHEGIVPGGTYNVRVIDASCNPSITASFSDPTLMQTAKFGDTVGTGGFQFPVDNNPVGVDDALAGIATFANASNKPSKSRTELASACIDNKANIDDVLMSLSGFSGGKHPQSPSTPDACNASCPNP